MVLFRDPCSSYTVGLGDEAVSLGFVTNVWLGLLLLWKGEEKAKRPCGKCGQSQEGHYHFYHFLTPTLLQGKLRDVAGLYV